MAHRAERIRKRKIREMIYQRELAEEYSYKVNVVWDNVITKAFGIPYNRLEYIDVTYFYDQMIRETN